MRVLVVLIVLGGCSAMEMESACTYTREVKTAYQCEAGGTVKHIKIESTQ